MNDNITKRLRQIQNENYIWMIYLFLIGFSFYANSLEKNYFLTHDDKSKNLYRKINASVFIVLIFIYAYFEKDAIRALFNKDKTKRQSQFDILSFIATTAVLISGFIFLYIILEDENLDEEIAFN